MALGGDALKALLSAPTVSKTTHFVLQAAPKAQVLLELPTGVAPDMTESVDNSPGRDASPLGLALVVPKRHAKRAATRNLVNWGFNVDPIFGEVEGSVSALSLRQHQILRN